MLVDKEHAEYYGPLMSVRLLVSYEFSFYVKI